MPSSYRVKVVKAGGSTCGTPPEELVNDQGSGDDYRDSGGGDLTFAALIAEKDGGSIVDWALTVSRLGTPCQVWPPQAATKGDSDPTGTYTVGGYEFTVDDV